MPKMRIEYNSITVDIDRDFNTYLDKKFVNNAVVQSSSGLEQTVNLFTQQKVRTLMRLVTAQKKQELDEWFEFVKDGTSFEFWRDWNLGTYIGFEGKSLDTNDGDTGTFTRALTTDSSYYLDPSTGLMTVINTVDIARFPEGQYGGGVLIEGARTNLCTHPSDFNNAAWVKGANITVSDNNTTETLDPIGTNIADKVTTSGGTRTLTFTTSTAIGTDDSGFSVLAKSPTGEVDIILAIEGTSGGQETSGTLNVVSNGQDGNGFTKYSVTHENDSSLTGDWRYVIVVENSLDLYLFGANMEAGADVLFPSQIIGAVSTSSSITRSIEKLLYSSANILNKEKGTLSFWVKPEYNAGSQEGETIFFQSGTTSTNSHIRIGFLNSTANLFIRAKLNNSSTTAWSEFDSSGGYIIKDTFAHIVYTYDSTISDGGKLYANGVLRLTTTNDPFNISDTGDQFTIGSNLDGTNVAFAVIDDFEVWKNVRDASWVNGRFNQGRGSGYGRNRFDNMLLDSYKTTERPNGFFDIELVMREQLS